MSVFSENLKKFRELKNFSKTYMARVLGLSLPAYSFYEAGEREPNLDNLQKIARCLGKTVDELLGYQLDADDLSPFKAAWEFAGWQVIGDGERVHLQKARWNSALLNGIEDSEIMRHKQDDSLSRFLASIDRVTFARKDFITSSRAISNRCFLESLPLYKNYVIDEILCGVLNGTADLSPKKE